jgi:3-hydroxy-9,10-secoandrosta-1,3,5(10)-triene-9,17-dione monooxygenase reductase component
VSATVDPRTFRNVLGQFCTGITVITTVHDGAPVGFACQSFAALSLDPPLVLFCPTRQSRSWAAIEATGRFCVNILHEKQKDVSARFGSREPDKFAGLEWRPSSLGSPVIDGSLAHLDCTVASVHDGGDHFVVFGAVHSLSESAADERSREEHSTRRKPRPLLFYQGQYTGIEPDKTTPADWRNDLEAFLTATTDDTWL